MQCVFEASTGLDAHMVLNLIEQHGIAGRIDGEYLQGGVGELQVRGFVRVMVEEHDYAEARKIIMEWESIQPASDGRFPEAPSPGRFQFFLIGVIVGAGIMYWWLKLPSL